MPTVGIRRSPRPSLTLCAPQRKKRKADLETNRPTPPCASSYGYATSRSTLTLAWASNASSGSLWLHSSASMKRTFSPPTTPSWSARCASLHNPCSLTRTTASPQPACIDVSAVRGRCAGERRDWSDGRGRQSAATEQVDPRGARRWAGGVRPAAIGRRWPSKDGERHFHVPHVAGCRAEQGVRSPRLVARPSLSPSPHATSA
eukprot:1152765-Prymnesium_polylepis.1